MSVCAHVTTSVGWAPETLFRLETSQARDDETSDREDEPAQLVLKTGSRNDKHFTSLLPRCEVFQ